MTRRVPVAIEIGTVPPLEGDDEGGRTVGRDRDRIRATGDRDRRVGGVGQEVDRRDLVREIGHERERTVGRDRDVLRRRSDGNRAAQRVRREWRSGTRCPLDHGDVRGRAVGRDRDRARAER